MTAKPLLWPQSIQELTAMRHAAWYAYWEDDLPALRASFPELANWDDRALISAMADYQSKILGSSVINMDRQQGFLDWIRLSCQHGAPLNAVEFSAMLLPT